MAVLLVLRKSAANARENAEGREDARCEPSSIDLFWSCVAGEFIACVDVATDKAKPATAINLIILLLRWPPSPLDLSPNGDGAALMFKQRPLTDFRR